MAVPPSLQVLFRDEQLIAVDKPAGMLVHRSALDTHDPVNVLRLLKQQTGCHLYPVHRLDKPTSGVLIFALTKGAARVVSAQFESHQITKNYLAVVRGYCPPEGTINSTIRDRDNPQRARQPAETHFHTLARIELPFAVDRYPSSRYSLLQIAPVTGRRHQIRQHLKHISHPIVGDSSYGKTPHNRFFNWHFQSTRLLLHACSLKLNHPVSRIPIEIRRKPSDAAYIRVLAHAAWQSAEAAQSE